MATYWEQFSFHWNVEKAGHIKWVVEELKKIDEDDDEEICGWKIEEDGRIWFYSEEGCQADDTARFLHRYLQTFKVTTYIMFEYSTMCTQPRTDAFGGGLFLVTADGIRYLTTWHVREQLEAQWRRGGNIHNEVHYYFLNDFENSRETEGTNGEVSDGNRLGDKDEIGQRKGTRIPNCS